jgi:hypothetical protein
MLAAAETVEGPLFRGKLCGCSLSVVTKRPKVEGGEQWGVKRSEVK